MNEFSGPGQTVDPQLLDRLVDGELDDARRRQLLQDLERQSSWRQCALAFLEAQSWRQALIGYEGAPAEVAPSLADAAAARISPSPLMGEGRGEGRSISQTQSVATSSEPVRHINVSATSPVHAPRHFEHWRSWVGMAASFLITLSLGMYIQHLWHPVDARSSAQQGIEAGMVQSLRAAKPALPDTARQSLEQAGFRIQHERVFVTVPLSNGQQISVPIDRVNIVPADAPGQ